MIIQNRLGDLIQLLSFNYGIYRMKTLAMVKAYEEAVNEVFSLPASN